MELGPVPKVAVLVVPAAVLPVVELLVLVAELLVQAVERGQGLRTVVPKSLVGRAASWHSRTVPTALYSHILSWDWLLR